MLDEAHKVPVSAVVPTRNRSIVLRRMLRSLAKQAVQPEELILVDASLDNESESVCSATFEGLKSRIVYQRAREVGAAAQRNQAVSLSSQPVILFLDDDIVFETHCIERLWTALQSDAGLGGVSAMITNQQYVTPGLVSRSLFKILNGQSRASYAGKCIGPALNLLPEDIPTLPEVVPVEWLNTTCTVYRRNALPKPPFASHFTGYSLMEDLALSLLVGKTWKLANARTARIYHDSQPSEYKANQAALARMELVNRHYVMTKILGRTRKSDYAKLALLETFGVVTPLVSPRAWEALPSVLIGKASAIRSIIQRPS